MIFRSPYDCTASLCRSAISLLNCNFAEVDQPSSAPIAHSRFTRISSRCLETLGTSSLALYNDGDKEMAVAEARANMLSAFHAIVSVGKPGLLTERILPFLPSHEADKSPACR